jgi:hypothetical protein
MVMRARSGLCLLSCLSVLLLACTAGPPPPSGTTTSLAPEAAADRLAEAATAAGVGVQRQADGMRLTTNSAQFVRCLAINVGGGDSRRVFTQVRERRGVLDVRLASAGATTEATWQGQWRGIYDNRVNNTTIEQPCTSTGALESLLARALAS